MEFHGEARRDKKTSLYSRWVMMRQRCKNENCKDYPHYGGRGIGICDEWNDYKSFSEWAYNNGYEEDLTLDRIDNDSGYKPDNCRWVPICINEQNRRIFKNNKTGIPRVSYSDSKERYVVYLDRFGKRLNIGAFANLEEAKLARAAAEKGFDFAAVAATQ